MDNSCQRLRTELSAYIDGQLDEKVQTEMQTHLSSCTPCNEELGSLKTLNKLLGEGMQQHNDLAMPDLWAQIEEQMPPICELMKDEFSAFLDGELPVAAQEGVNNHLKECESCLAEFKLLNSANQLLAKSLELPETVNVDLWPAVKARLNADCALIHSELSDYADQEVTTLRHRDITNHLVECGDCRQQFSQLSSLGEIIRESYQPNLPADFDLWPAVRNRLQVVPFTSKSSGQAERPAKPRMARRQILVAAVAAVMLGVVGSAGIFMMSPKPAQANTMSAEAYLIESALMEPADVAEAAVYEQN